MIAAPDLAGLPSLPPTVPVVGCELHPVSLPAAAAWTLAAAGAHGGGGRPAATGGASPQSMPRALVVTLNPEIVVRARDDAELAAALRGAALVVPDGVGILWAARRAGHALPGRVPGVELVEGVLAAGGASLRVFFLGGRPGVAERAAEVSARRWGTSVAGVRHGYFDHDSDGDMVADEVAASRAGLLLAGLGERQEAFLWRQRLRTGGGVAIGVGGTLDVLAGAVRRSPDWTRRLGVEWAYRVGLDPARWHRVPRLVRFAGLVLAAHGRAAERRAAPGPADDHDARGGGTPRA